MHRGTTRKLVKKAGSWAPPQGLWRRKVLGAAQESALPIKALGDSAVMRFFLIDLFYFWLHWVFIAVRSFSLVVAGGGYCLVVV